MLHESKPARARPTRRALFPAPHRPSASHRSSGAGSSRSGSCIMCLASSFSVCVYASTRRSTRRCGSACAVAHPRLGPSGMPAPGTPHRRSGGHTKPRAEYRNDPLQTSATRGEGRLHPVGAPRVGPKDATRQNKVVADNNRDAPAAAAAAAGAVSITSCVSVPGKDHGWMRTRLFAAKKRVHGSAPVVRAAGPVAAPHNQPPDPTIAAAAPSALRPLLHSSTTHRGSPRVGSWFGGRLNAGGRTAPPRGAAPPGLGCKSHGQRSAQQREKALRPCDVRLKQRLEWTTICRTTTCVISASLAFTASLKRTKTGLQHLRGHFTPKNDHIQAMWSHCSQYSAAARRRRSGRPPSFQPLARVALLLLLLLRQWPHCDC